MNDRDLTISIFKAAALTAALLAQSWAMSVSPARTEVRLAPGDTMRHEFTIVNTHPDPYNVEVSEKSWFVLPENKDIPISQWIILKGKKHFLLKPGESRKVPVVLRCPKKAVGELVGMVSFAYRPLQPSMITPMISCSVYLDAIGTEKKSGEIVALGAGTREGKFSVAAQVKATGNVHLRPVGKIVLTAADGRATEYTVPEMEPVYPGTTRNYSGRGPDALPAPGRYVLSADLHAGELELKAEQPLRVDAKGDVKLDSKTEDPSVTSDVKRSSKS